MRTDWALIAALALTLALTAVDANRWSEPVLIEAAAVGAGTTAAWIGARRLDGQGRHLLLSSAGLLLAWVAWAVVSALASTGITGFAVGATFGAVLLATVALVQNGESDDFAVVMVGAFVLYLGISSLGIASNELQPELDGRLALASLEANQLARIAGLTALSGLWLIPGNRGWLRLIGVAAAVGGASIVVVTTSRTAVVGMAAGAVVLAVFVARKRLAALATGLLLIGAAFALAGASDPLGSSLPVGGELAARSTQNIDTLNGRRVMWPRIVDIIETHPVSGVGLGNDRAVILEEIEVGWNVQHTHNLALHVALTTGLVGAVVLLVAIAVGFLRSAARPQPLSLALLLFIVLDGLAEPVLIRASFGWFAVVGAVVLADATRRADPRALPSAADSGQSSRPSL